MMLYHSCLQFDLVESERVIRKMKASDPKEGYPGCHVDQIHEKHKTGTRLPEPV